LGAGRPHDGADGLGHAAPAADDSAHVALRHMQAKGDGVPSLVALDDDGLGVIDDRLGQVRQHVPGQGPDDAVDVFGVVVEIVVVVVYVGHDAAADPPVPVPTPAPAPAPVN